ncbi:hypothetical protein [Thalassovita sp.]|uniref:hypothetical protein n=1 Tax=Thalassovita sp. TaxID=1979401 RepID=UPI002B270B09|nr:hypothetical protein [Thalassovita sp.]
MKRRQFLTMSGTTLTAALLPGPRLYAQGQALKMRSLYNKDLSFSDLAQQLVGERITVTGFMAPPLKAEANFFVLTNKPMAVCPFCETEAEWPDDILAVYTKRTVRVTPFNVKIQTNGVLELGAFTDPETGFVSRVRLTGARYS